MVMGSQTGALAARAASVRTRFVVGAFWSLAGAVVSRGLTLAASALEGRLLGSAVFGELEMVQSTQESFGVFTGSALGLAATKYVAEHQATDWLKASRCLKLATFGAVVLGVAAGG